MSISGIGSTGSVVSLSDFDSSTAPKATASTPDAGAAASASISKPGELMSKLQQLLQQDPDKFKQVAGSIATSLRSAAQSAGASGGGFLNQLADRFDQAAKTGDLSSLQPQQGPAQQGPAGASHHHHGHHGHGGGSGGVASAMMSALDQVNQALDPSTSPGAAVLTDPTATPTAT